MLSIAADAAPKAQQMLSIAADAAAEAQQMLCVAADSAAEAQQMLSLAADSASEAQQMLYVAANYATEAKPAVLIHRPRVGLLGIVGNQGAHGRGKPSLGTAWLGTADRGGPRVLRGLERCLWLFSQARLGAHGSRRMEVT